MGLESALEKSIGAAIPLEFFSTAQGGRNMSSTAESRALAVLSGFAIFGKVVHVERWTIGHIHESFAVTVDHSGARIRYFLQRINTRVFPRIPQLMENIQRVCSYAGEEMRRRGVAEVSRRALSLVPARDGQAWVADLDGAPYRLYNFIERTRSFDRAETPGQAETAACAFGSFLRLLDGIPDPRLNDTIPDFHNTVKRLATFEQAVECDAAGRADEVREDIAFALDRKALADRLLRLHAAGLVPERVTHNDTKYNNILFDDASDEPVCVVDLDTVMPGLSLYDFGDMARFACNGAAEDETDLNRVGFRADVFEALVRGWLQSAGDIFRPAEIEALPLSVRVITFEQGIRFLTDYLNGDLYYPTTRPGQNLDRCRTQFELVRKMEIQAEALDEIRDRLYNTWRLG